MESGVFARFLLDVDFDGEDVGESAGLGWFFGADEEDGDSDVGRAWVVEGVERRVRANTRLKLSSIAGRANFMAVGGRGE